MIIKSNAVNNNAIDTGRLQINVFDTNVGMPISDAVVRIMPRGSTDVIEELTSNSSGKTDTVDLAAPPVELSQTPETEEQPYTDYDILVEANGFEPVKIDGTQILPDSKALQNINMTPIATTSTAEQNIYIEPHTLWGVFPPKIPEAEVKPLPPSLGFVVLPEPVVPEFVVVHLGAPSDTSARNVYIPFNDYIKNCASCEIYSTWPTETIMANVLAIISFTLNRVYTEWYRGKGYDFTITNSTAYDQSFVYERNIFEEISVVVDDLFSTFITRPDIRQPLFTQYCDGSRVQCPLWLEQWGSKYLGEQGYLAIDILKNYYGSDIFLMQAERVSGIPISYPGSVLQMGSSGSAVRTIQEQLNRISNNYPAIPKVIVDGVYGDQTRIAVETFQSIFNYPVTGVVDYGTWYKISNIYVAVTKMAEL